MKLFPFDHNPTHDELVNVASQIEEQPCIDCGKPGGCSVGTFLPFDPSEFGGVWIVLYPVHSSCDKNAQLVAREQSIMDHLMPGSRN